MHTEHLQNVRTGRVLMAWLIAASVTSLAAFAFIAAGRMTEDATTANTVWSSIAVLIGFFAGGFWVGFRAIQAPVLHAVGIGLTSLASWFILNVVANFFFPTWEWPSMTTELAIGLLFGQLAASAVGALLGYNMALRGKPGLSEHEPI